MLHPPLQPLLVHDWLNQDGGAEVVLDVLQREFPASPIFTSIVDLGRVPRARGWDLRPSWLDRLPGIHAHHQAYMPLYPVDWGSRRLPGAGLVLSNKSGFCHGVRAGAAVHVCYCLTPTRYVWEPEGYLEHERVPPGGKLALRLMLPWLRRWDRRAAQGVDRFVAISGAVQDRVRRYYGRESEVIHPPTDLSRFGSGPDARLAPPAGDYDLVLARLAPYKRIDLAVAAFNRLGRRLVIVGDGRDRARLEALAGPTIELRGRLPQAEVDALLAGCRALIWPGVEDFGLAPVEAMAAGRPVVAFRAGGALDTVAEGRTGVFFDRQDADSLARAVVAAEGIDWSPGEIRRHAAQFGVGPFVAKLRRMLEAALADGKRRPARP